MLELHKDTLPVTKSLLAKILNSPLRLSPRWLSCMAPHTPLHCFLYRASPSRKGSSCPPNTVIVAAPHAKPEGWWLTGKPLRLHGTNTPSLQSWFTPITKYTIATPYSLSFSTPNLALTLSKHMPWIWSLSTMVVWVSSSVFKSFF